MPTTPQSFLLASPDPTLLAAIEPVLHAAGARAEIVLTAEAALAAITASHPPALALLDVTLPGIPLSQFLAAARSTATAAALPIVLIADAVTPELADRLAEGVIDDLIPRAAEPAYWRIRIDQVQQARRRALELDSLRDAAVLNAQTDRLTGIYNRETILAMLFRETDRVQRTKASLCMVLFDIDDFGHWNSRLGSDACDDLLCKVVNRTARLLRSYDLFGRPGKDEFLIALPGCSAVSAIMLAERLRHDVFSSPFRVSDQSIRLSACFGIASSHGRSPVVVLREAEQALLDAKVEGPESIHCYDGSLQPIPAPVAFFSPTTGDELLAW
jgi:two-component system, cell cycle response regulator